MVAELTSSLELQLSTIYRDQAKRHRLTVNVQPAQQPEGDSDHWLKAGAVATELCFGGDPFE